jgi:hypothetical protein
MSIYGLSVFLETPKQERKGRVFYIITSFTITALSALCTALDASRTFIYLLEADSGVAYIKLRLIAMIDRHILTLMSSVSLRCLVLIGDALMVCERTQILTSKTQIFVSGVSLLGYLERESVDGISSRSELLGIFR